MENKKITTDPFYDNLKIDALATSISLELNNNILLRTIVDLLLESRSSATGESIEELEAHVQKLMEANHEMAKKYIVEAKK